MEKALKEKWIEALRSGKYKQGRLVLRTKTDDYCCFGVLCDVSNISEWEANGPCYSYDGAASLLPPRLRDQLTLEARKDLMAMNDNSGMSFPDIADWIKLNIPEDDQ